jgi:hypothetical protein
MPTPIRFPTEAANADSMQEDAPRPAAQQVPKQPGARKQGPADSADGTVKPGKDINAPGFVRDKDAGKP